MSCAATRVVRRVSSRIVVRCKVRVVEDVQEIAADLKAKFLGGAAAELSYTPQIIEQPTLPEGEQRCDCV